MLFKTAYARGALQALIETNLVKVADEEAADAIAQTAGESLPEEPVEAVSPQVTTELASNLVQLSDALQASADSAGQAAEAAAAVKGAALRKRSSSQEENTLPSAAGENEEAAMDAAQRPEGYANVGVAGVGTQAQSGEGAIGKEQPTPPTNAAPGPSNSAVDAIKGASLRQLIKKVAEGSLIVGDQASQKNNLPEAAKVTEEAAMDASARPMGYASEGEDGVGNSAMAEKSRAGAVGKEEKVQPAAPAGTNSAVEQSKTSEDEEYARQFVAAANKYARFLPQKFSQNEKIAAVQYLMSMVPAARERLVSNMTKSAEIPPQLAAYVHEHAESKDEEKKEDEKKDGKKDEKKEDKKDEEKKGSVSTDLLARLRNLK